jgi:histidinol-phosphate aminotransferase
VSETIAERGRLARALGELGFAPLPSHANFVYVPTESAHALYERLLAKGLVIRPFDGAIRITVHEPAANDRLLDALEQAHR